MSGNKGGEKSAIRGAEELAEYLSKLFVRQILGYEFTKRWSYDEAQGALVPYDREKRVHVIFEDGGRSWASDRVIVDHVKVTVETEDDIEELDLAITRPPSDQDRSLDAFKYHEACSRGWSDRQTWAIAYRYAKKAKKELGGEWIVVPYAAFGKRRSCAYVFAFKKSVMVDLASQVLSTVTKMAGGAAAAEAAEEPGAEAAEEVEVSEEEALAGWVTPEGVEALITRVTQPPAEEAEARPEAAKPEAKQEAKPELGERLVKVYFVFFDLPSPRLLERWHVLPQEVAAQHSVDKALGLKYIDPELVAKVRTARTYWYEKVLKHCAVQTSYRQYIVVTEEDAKRIRDFVDREVLPVLEKIRALRPVDADRYYVKLLPAYVDAELVLKEINHYAERLGEKIEELRAKAREAEKRWMRNRIQRQVDELEDLVRRLRDLQKRLRVIHI